MAADEVSSQEARVCLSDAQWHSIVLSLSGNMQTRAKHDQQHHYRAFIEAVLWVAANRAFWNELPAEYGSWRSVYARFLRWHEAGIWARIEGALGTSAHAALLSLLLTHYQNDQHRRQLRLIRKAPHGADDFELQEHWTADVRNESK
ncbi:transposase [Lysobacter antibioticus]|uniref:transposase n=1 Tax=Lysobacter antibioticus TaxID=84531 RepID=UPI0009E7D831